MIGVRYHSDFGIEKETYLDLFKGCSITSASSEFLTNLRVLKKMLPWAKNLVRPTLETELNVAKETCIHLNLRRGLARSVRAQI